MNFLKNKKILVTGGTGSFGKEFCSYLLKNHSPKKLIIYSRDELKQFELKKICHPDLINLLHAFYQMHLN